MSFLRCTGLTKRFGGFTAVDRVHLDVERGHTFALLGPSGCGKTTLLRMIAGFEFPDEGSVELGEKVLSGRGRFLQPEQRRIGMVFQDYALFPHMDLRSNVAFGLSGGGDKRKRAENLLDMVGLGGLGSRMPHELSGGQQQRVALARSLAVEPELVLLDEPFSNLDPGLRTRVRTEVRQIIESLGITAVFVTHDQEEALSVAERVAVMLEGRIQQVDRPGEVYRHPSSRAVAEFLGDANFLPGEVQRGAVQFEVGRAPVDPHVEGPVQVMIRPESLALSPEDGLPVKVISSEYFGHDQMVTVALASGTVLKVRLLPTLDVTPGQDLGLRLTGDVVVYPVTPPSDARAGS